MAEMIDCICCEAAIDELYKLPCKIDEDGYRWVLSRDVAHMIDSIPDADVRPVVRGKWKFEIGDGKTCVDGWVCTNCNCGFHTNVPYFEGFNFCPNCGADMRPNLDTTKGGSHD